MYLYRSNTNKLAVMSYDETDGWSGNYTVSESDSWWTSIEFNSENTPYVLYRDNANYAKASVKKFDGSDWVYHGNPGFTPGAGDYAKLAIDSQDKVYMVYRNTYADWCAQVMSCPKDGTIWTSVGPSALKEANDETIAIDSTDKLYIAFTDFLPDGSEKATVLMYNDTNWIGLGEAGFSAGNAYNTDIALDSNDVPYVVYIDDANGSKATVMMYDGVDWIPVGNPGFSADSVDFTTIAIDSNNTPYVAYQDTTSGKATVMKFNGNEWIPVGTVDFSDADALWIELKIDDNDTLYVAYQDGDNIMVERYVEATTTKTFTLTAAAGTGGSWTTDPSGTSDVGEIVSLDFTADGGYKFNRWTGDNAKDVVDDGGGNYSIYMNGNKTITAEFVLTTQQYNLTANNDGNGSVTLFPSGGTYDAGTTVTLDPTGSGDYIFDYWSGANADELINNGDGTYDIVVDSNKTVTANFIETFTLTATAGIGGTLDVFPGTGPYKSGSLVILTPIANTNYKFDEWTGANAGEITAHDDGTYSIEMTGDKVVNANFVTAYALNIDNDGYGNVSLDPAGGVYEVGTTVTITPVPNSGYLFESWTGTDAGDVSGPDGNGDFTITMGSAEKSITANFVLDWVELDGPSDSGGYVDLEFSTDNTPYVAYKNSTTSKAVLSHYDGSSWIDSEVSPDEAWWLSFEFNSNDIPYVGYRDILHPYRGSMKRLVSGNWLNVGNEGFTLGAFDYGKLQFDNAGTPYVAYRNSNNGYKAHAMKFNGSNWVSVGSTSGFSSSDANWIDLAINNNGYPYVVYKDDGNANKATVMAYDGSSWGVVGSAGFSADIADYTTIEIDSNDTPYVAYKDEANGDGITVMSYDGASWNVVGSAGFSTGIVDHVSLAIDGENTPYVAYQDNAIDKIVVMKFDGGSWVKLGPLGFSDNAVDSHNGSIDLEISKTGVPYVAYSMGNNVMVERFSDQTTTTYTLTVTEGSNGSVSLNPSGGTYEAGTSVILTPNPDSGNIFDGWSGTDAGSVIDNGNGTYTIVMNNDKSIEASFASAGPPDAPTFDPTADDFADGLANIEISTTTTGALIRYTLDGSTPSATNGILYTDPVNPAGHYETRESDRYAKFYLDLKAVAYNGAGTSDVTTGEFTITPDKTDVYEMTSAYDDRDVVVVDGKYYMVYRNRDDWNIYYLTNESGTWSPEQLTNNGNQDRPVDLAVDGNGNVHILYLGVYTNPGDLYYITNTGGSWSSPVTISSDIDAADIISDNSNNIHVSYIKDSKVYYVAESGGSWSEEQISGSSETIAYINGVKMAVDSTGQFHIAYGNEDKQLKFVTGSSGSWATPELVETTTDNNYVIVDDIILDSNNKTYICYNFDNYRVKVADNVSGDWAVEEIDFYYRFDGYLTFDNDGYLNLVYSRSNNGAAGLCYATNRSGSWEKHFVSYPVQDITGKKDGESPVIYIDGSDVIHILHGTYKGSSTGERWLTECTWKW